MLGDVRSGNITMEHEKGRSEPTSIDGATGGVDVA